MWIQVNCVVLPVYYVGIINAVTDHFLTTYATAVS